MKKIFVFLLLICCSLHSDAQKLLMGGDISMLPKYEEAGTVYRDSSGRAVDALRFFVDNGWNAMRVRLFNDPMKASAESKDEGVCQDIDYVCRLSRRAKDAGMEVMLDFHYSDTWADPSHQTVPDSWKDCSAAALCDSVYMFTRNSLIKMKEAGAEPELIQVGNEITNGMIWPIGKINHDGNDNWDVLCGLVESGVRACREICPESKIIIHTEKMNNWNLTKVFYTEMEKHKIDYDIIGFSYYPMWHDSLDVMAATLDSAAVCFKDKEVMMVEAACFYSYENDKWVDFYKEYPVYYPLSKEGQGQFTKDLVAELKRHKNVTGLFWWFPEENESGKPVISSWLNRGLFDNKTGRALPAFYEMSKYLR